MYEELQGLTDNRFGSLGEYSIVKCYNCELLQTIPILDEEKQRHLYETFYNFGGERKSIYTRFRDVFLSSLIYRFFIAIDGDISFHLSRGTGRLLDVGCNEGRGLKIYSSNGFEAQGLELNKRAAQDTRIKGFTVFTQPIEKFQPEEPFDIVVLSNVLEHVSNPINMLNNVRRVLKPNGYIWISCPNSNSWLRRLFGGSWINWHVPFHIYHFSRKTLSQILKLSGFEIKRIKFVTPIHWLIQSILTAIFAKPGQETRQLHNPFIIAFLIIFCQFFFPLLKLGNLTGYGDCLVVVAVPSTKDLS
jgi:2-polyprenyl-3-methyl-5-hydroxy-6-metoxy-1,4-benzoquinol methylase